MKPVDQTTFPPPVGNGNCFQACVASILELPLSEVPHFVGDGWFCQWLEWLKPMNLTMFIIEFQKWGEVPPGYSILGAKSLRGDWLHAVVCLDGEIVHDPHPDRHQGVGERVDWTLFLVLDPSKPILEAKS